MSRIEKMKTRLAAEPSDYTFEEWRSLLCALGFEEMPGGKTGGSRVAFHHPPSRLVIRLHRPHPGPNLKRYQIRQVVSILKSGGRL